MVTDFLRSVYVGNFALDEEGAELIKGRFFWADNRPIKEEPNPFRSGVWLDPYDRGIGVGDQATVFTYDNGLPPAPYPIVNQRKIARVSRLCGQIPMPTTDDVRDGLPSGCFDKPKPKPPVVWKYCFAAAGLWYFVNPEGVRSDNLIGYQNVPPDEITPYYWVRDFDPALWNGWTRAECRYDLEKDEWTLTGFISIKYMYDKDRKSVV